MKDALSKMKVSELKAKIKEDIIEILSEQDEEVDVAVEDEVKADVDVDVEESVAVAVSEAPTAELPQDNGAVDGSVGDAAAVKPEQPAEQEQSAALDSEITEFDASTSGTAEQHGEQAEASRGEQGKPDGATKPAPGGA